MTELPNDIIIKAIFSNPISNDIPKKISFEKIENKNQYWIKTFRIENKMMTERIESEINVVLSELLEKKEYKNVNFFSEENEYQYLFSKKGKFSVIKHKNPGISAKDQHNEKKNYLIPEGSDAPFLKDLGIFTSEGKVVSKMYDKFRQINRFAEILDHTFNDIDKNEISIIDFGCGKSYLTFVIYYYFVKIKKIKARIFGYDLKKDVVDNCNLLAKKYGYVGLSFVVADVIKDKLTDEKIDMVISLHACDTATDACLLYAIKKQVKYIFSVPCCQHEIGNQIKKGGDFDILLNHGLIKERFSALLTDSVRLEVLRAVGYQTDAIEFVDFTHSPKNLMIRAKKVGKADAKKLDELLMLEEKYNFKQSLLNSVVELIND